VTLAHLLKLLLILELLLEGVISVAFLQYLNLSWYWLLLCILVLFVLVRALILGSEFGIAAWINRNLAPTRLSCSAWCRCIGREMLVMMSNFSFHMAVPSWFNRWALEKNLSQPEPKHRGVVVLVHGIACNAVVWRSMRAYLLQQGWAVKSLNLHPIFAPIQHYAAALHTCIENCCQEYTCDQVMIVAHSMGGLVLRSYLQHYGDQCLAHAITIATPHQGSVLAAIGQSANIRDMHRNSAYLLSLNSSHYAHKISCFLTQHDNLVIPYDSAQLPGSESVVFSGTGHVSLLFDIELQAQVHKTLSQHSSKMNTFE
jgi:triacylglycerol lipase